MNLFASLFKKLRGASRARWSQEPPAYEQWRQALSSGFSGLVLERPAIETLLASLPSETRQSVLSTGFDEIEARVFDLWLVSYALRRSLKHIARPELLAALDGGHLEVYRQLISRGMSEAQVMTLQGRLAQRYAEYDDAYAASLDGEQRQTFSFARLVTLHVFLHATEDARVAATLATAIVNSTVISIGEAFGDLKSPST
jgi:cytochrome P450